MVSLHEGKSPKMKGDYCRMLMIYLHVGKGLCVVECLRLLDFVKLYFVDFISKEFRTSES